MKNLLLIFFIVFLQSCVHDTTEIDNLIDKINWNSISINHTGVGDHVVYSDSVVKRLIEIGKPAVNQLIASLSIPEKTVTIHMILTKILEKQNCTDYLSKLYIYKDCNLLIGWHSIYNKLVWEWTEENDLTISQKEINKIIHYWKGRQLNTIQIKTENTDSIFSVLEANDNITYPCHKVYENNSKNLDINELIKLFNQKLSSADIQSTFKKLGNDSTMNFDYLGGLTINYSDGIIFEFNKESLLISIFFDYFYEGKLFKGLTIKNSKEIALQKFGKPEILPTGNFKYKKQNMILFFDDNLISGIRINRQEK